MISERKVKCYCREDLSKIKNYEQAINDKTQTWHCHHINEITFTREELIKMNMYYNRPSDELVFLTSEEHIRLHRLYCNSGKVATEKMRKTKKGSTLTKQHKQKISSSLKGVKFTEEHKQRISKSGKGKIKSEFTRKFIEHFGITPQEDIRLYWRETAWYSTHNKICRWEI